MDTYQTASSARCDCIDHINASSERLFTITKPSPHTDRRLCVVVGGLGQFHSFRKEELDDFQGWLSQQTDERLLELAYRAQDTSRLDQMEQTVDRLEEELARVLRELVVARDALFTYKN